MASDDYDDDDDDDDGGGGSGGGGRAMPYLRRVSLERTKPTTTLSWWRAAGLLNENLIVLTCLWLCIELVAG